MHSELKPLIINVALTGNVPSKANYRRLPVTPTEIVRDVRECFELGARVFHLHMRDSDGNPFKIQAYSVRPWLGSIQNAQKR